MASASICPVILTDLNIPWEKALHLGTPANFTPKQIIEQKANPDEAGFFYIRRGLIRLSYISPSGLERVLFFVGKNSFFLDVPTILQDVLCVFTCMETTTAVFFRKKMVNTAFVSQYPDLMINWLEATAKKSNHFFTMLCGEGLYSTFVNVCRQLYSMVVFQQENGKVVPRMTLHDMAGLLSIHRGSLHKELTRLRREGIIGDYNRHKLEVYDVQRLREYALGEN